eukprot:943442-Amorphochlora_amoeboformis.AAC.1
MHKIDLNSVFALFSPRLVVGDVVRLEADHGCVDWGSKYMRRERALCSFRMLAIGSRDLSLFDIHDPHHP